MAGSLAHITNCNGGFYMDMIENMGDAYEALEECFGIIQHLSQGDNSRISFACKKLHYPDPYKKEDDCDCEYCRGDKISQPDPDLLDFDEGWNRGGGYAG